MLGLVVVVAAACDGGDDTVMPYPKDTSRGGTGGASAGAAGAGVAGAGAGGVGGNQAVAGSAGQSGTGGATAGSGGLGGSAGAGGLGGGGAAGASGSAGASGGGAAGFGGTSVAGSAGASGAAGTAGASGASGSGGAISCPPGLGPGVDEKRAVFVAADAAAGGDGTMDKPLAKIQDALVAVVAKGGGTVVVAEGTYAETLAFGGLAEGMGTVPTVVRGGYLRSGGTWSDDCVPGNVAERTIVAPTAGIPVTFTNVSNDSGLERLRVVAPKTAAATPDDAGVAGASSIAIVVRGAAAKVRVLASLVEASDAQPAIAPKKPANAPTAKCLGTPVSCGDGTDGSPAPSPVEDTAVPGSFAADGSFTPATGFVGAKGGDAADGTPGGPGPNASVPAGCAQNPLPLQPGLCNCVTLAKAVGGNAGRCGCGGNGGRPGVAGRGGGASAGIVVTGAQATLRLEGSTVRAGKGGDGAPGSEGGEGGTGSPGATGDPKDEAGLSCACGGAACPQALQPCNGVCPTVPVTQPVPGGPAGGVGGKGGKGSKAGDAAGGPSCALVLLAGATLEKDAATTLTPGMPGKGGGAALAGKTGGTCNF